MYNRGMGKILLHTLTSVGLWSFDFGGFKTARFLAKNQYTPRKVLYFVNTPSAVSTKMGIILENKMSKNWS